jgi:hypothetical protein
MTSVFCSLKASSCSCASISWDITSIIGPIATQNHLFLPKRLLQVWQYFLGYLTGIAMVGSGIDGLLKLIELLVANLLILRADPLRAKQFLRLRRYLHLVPAFPLLARYAVVRKIVVLIRVNGVDPLRFVDLQCTHLFMCCGRIPAYRLLWRQRLP